MRCFRPAAAGLRDPTFDPSFDQGGHRDRGPDEWRSCSRTPETPSSRDHRTAGAGAGRGRRLRLRTADQQTTSSTLCPMKRKLFNRQESETELTCFERSRVALATSLLIGLCCGNAFLASPSGNKRAVCAVKPQFSKCAV